MSLIIVNYILFIKRLIVPRLLGVFYASDRITTIFFTKMLFST